MAKVSIIIPCYNSSRTLKETLESACAQIEVDREILVVDDGSIDDTIGIARMFSPTVRIVSGTNRGISFARNWGIAETRGEWIVFLDHDDLLLPGTLEERLRTASLTDCDVILCDYFDLLQTNNGTLDRKIKRVDFELLKANGEIACLDDISITTAALMYSRNIVETIGGFREDLPIIQDQRFLFDAAHHGARFAYSPHIGAEYRILPSSLSHRRPELVWVDMLKNTQEIETLWRASGQLSSKQKDALARIFDYLARNFFSVSHPGYFRAVKYLRGTVDCLPLHSRIAEPLATAVGLRAARQILEVPRVLNAFSMRFRGCLRFC